MKRLHVNVAVENLDQAIRFYSTLFATKPSVEKSDYAKWMLDDPRVNFAITARGRATGLDHLGIQVESEAELSEVYDRLSRADAPVVDQGNVTCCYAKSTKSWITDPAGISWETFLTHGDATQYGGDGDGMPVAADAKSACCGEKPEKPAFSCCS
ncbi:ArsI/CadI family heavy metal resistance metalloenzyme [Dongia sp.]|uniref:ArsI/CadI family heavy metal resistance metalloenzyme n=1 Tax=Dongia sp. TaxID=1977262 RepID=UPI0035B2A727